MRIVRVQTALRLILSVVIALLLAFGCSDKLVDNRTGGNVSIELSVPQASPALSEAINLVVLTVSADDMDTIVDSIPWLGGIILVQINVPIGVNRKFHIQAIEPLVDQMGGRVIYSGEILADIGGGIENVVRVPLEPAVPLIRVTPRVVVIPAGESFQLKLEIFSLADVADANVRVSPVGVFMDPDSVARGSMVDVAGTDTFTVVYGDGMPVDISIESDNAIVDGRGFGHLATLYYSTMHMADTEFVVDFLPSVSLLVTVDGTNLSPEGVYQDGATLDLVIPPDRPVEFPDPLLETAVRNELDVQDTIWLSAALDLWSLRASEVGITDLTGINQLANLSQLILSYSNISDVTPIAGMRHIWELDLRGNLISDISTLSTLTNLSRLYLGENFITDLSPLLENPGLGTYDSIDVVLNPLDANSINVVIPELINRGVGVGY